MGGGSPAAYAKPRVCTEKKWVSMGCGRAWLCVVPALDGAGGVRRLIGRGAAKWI